MKRLAYIILACALAAPASRAAQNDDAWFAQAPAASGWTTITGLVAHWKMNDNAATKTVADSYGGNTGTSVRNTSDMTTNGLINSALSFNGTNDYVDSSIPWTLTKTSTITYCAWVMPLTSAAKNKRFVDTVSSYGQFGVGLECGWGSSPSNALGIYAGKAGIGSVDIWHSSAATIYHWYHVCGTFDGATQTLFIDGQYSTQKLYAAYVASTTPNTNGISIGAEKYGGNLYYLFNAVIDDVRIYNRVLSTNELSQIYNGGAGTEQE